MGIAGVDAEPVDREVPVQALVEGAPTPTLVITAEHTLSVPGIEPRAGIEDSGLGRRRDQGVDEVDAWDLAHDRPLTAAVNRLRDVVAESNPKPAVMGGGERGRRATRENQLPSRPRIIAAPGLQVTKETPRLPAGDLRVEGLGICRVADEVQSQESLVRKESVAGDRLGPGLPTLDAPREPTVAGGDDAGR